MADPKCQLCKWCVSKQCTREWPDATYTGTTLRRITVAEDAGELFPAWHVYRFWCQGNQFKSILDQPLVEKH